MKSINFEEYKSQILTALNGKLPSDKNFALIDGFIFTPLQKQTGSLQLGGPSLPQVAVADITTGEIHYFALKALLPDLLL